MKTKNLAVGILLAVLTLALWWNFLLKPSRAQVSKVHADTEVERAKVRPLQAQLDLARIDASHADEFKAQLKSLQRAMPNSPAQAAFTRDANGIAEDSGISWQSVTHGPPTPGEGGASSITLGIQVRGTYPQVIDYLGRLAKLDRLLIVDTVQFSSAGTSGAGAGSAATSSGASTGPFSGSSELTVTISARMFDLPPGGVAAVNPDGTAAAAPSTGAPSAGAPSAATPPALNNS